MSLWRTRVSSHVGVHRRYIHLVPSGSGPFIGGHPPVTHKRSRQKILSSVSYQELNIRLVFIIIKFSKISFRLSSVFYQFNTKYQPTPSDSSSSTSTLPRSVTSEEWRNEKVLDVRPGHLRAFHSGGLLAGGRSNSLLSRRRWVLYSSSFVHRNFRRTKFGD